MLGQPLTQTVGHNADQVFDRKVKGSNKIAVFDDPRSANGTENGAPPPKKQYRTSPEKLIYLDKGGNDDNDDDDDDDDDNDDNDGEYEAASRARQNGDHGSAGDDGPLIASVNADGNAHARLVGDSGACEDALIGEPLDKVAPKARVSGIDNREVSANGNGLRSVVNGVGSAAGGSDRARVSGKDSNAGAETPNKLKESMPKEPTPREPKPDSNPVAKTKILDPMVPLEILKPQPSLQQPAHNSDNFDPYQAYANGYRSQKSARTSSSQDGSLASSSGSFGGSTSDSSVPDDNSRNREGMPLSQDARFAGLVAAGMRGQGSRQANSRSEPAQFPNMLSDMYSQPAALPLLPTGLRDAAPNAADSSHIPSVDRFSEIAYSHARAPTSPGPSLEAPRFRYNYQNGTPHGYPFAVSSAPNPLQYGSFLYFPNMSGSDQRLPAPVEIMPSQHDSRPQGNLGQLNGHRDGVRGIHQDGVHRPYLMNGQPESEHLHYQSSGKSDQPPYKGSGDQEHRQREGTRSAAPYPNGYSTLVGAGMLPHSGQVPASSVVPVMMAPPVMQDQHINERGPSHDESAQPGEERVYRCPEPSCQWSFVRSSDLKRHIRSHKEPSLKCPYWEITPNCNRKGGMFHRLDVLKRHLRLVHLNRPTDGRADGGQCQVCLRKFARTKDFINHCDSCALDAHNELHASKETNKTD